MSTSSEPVDEILRKLAKDVELAVHAMYRRQHGPSTTQVRTDQFVRDAKEHIDAAVAGAPPPPPRASATALPSRFSASASADAVPGDGTSGSWSAGEANAVTKCVLGWLSMGSPTSAKPDSRCVAAGSQLLPTWGEREQARAAIRKVQIS